MCVFPFAELSPRSPAGSWLGLHGQNAARSPFHDCRGGLPALRPQVSNPRPRGIRTVSGDGGHEPAARARHTPPADQGWASQPAPHTHLSLSLQEGAGPSPVSPGRCAQRELPSLMRLNGDGSVRRLDVWGDEGAPLRRSTVGEGRTWKDLREVRQLRGHKSCLLLLSGWRSAFGLKVGVGGFICRWRVMWEVVSRKK